MKIKGLLDIDLINYKKPCMTIMMPCCNGFKCGLEYCQNNMLAVAPVVDIADDKIIEYYFKNPITEAVCMQGLEPFDSADELFNFIQTLRQNEIFKADPMQNFMNLFVQEDNFKVSPDALCDIVIYTGYTKEELEEKGYLTKLKNYAKIKCIVKYGRFIPNQEPHRDEVLGVNLASNNQYAERIC